MSDAGLDRPVFVVGVPRSGTTLLCRTLLQHPAFGARSMDIESHAVDLLHDYVDAGAVAPERLCRYLGTAELPDDVLAVVRRLRRRRMSVRRVLGPWSMRPRAWQLGGEHRVVRAYFAAATRSRPGSRLVEKTPGHLHRVAHLRRAFPDAQFVCIHRHPVDVLNSHWARFARQPEQEWANVSVDHFAGLWARGVEAADRWAATLPTAFPIITYEDLARSPEEVVGRVLDHLDEPFDPRCVESFDRSATESETPRDDRPMSERERHWSQHVSLDTAARLERLLAAP